MSLGSPCIDAGNPGSPFDPDGTVADMGALFFNHPVEITVAPNSPPIIIPPEGGTFSFEATIANTSDMAVEVEVWTMVDVPGVGHYGPLIKRSIHLAPHQTIYRPNLSQSVPGFAPGGDYYYIGYVGNYPDKMDSSSFAFSKTGESTGRMWSVNDWFEETAGLSLPIRAVLLGNYPNPFNSSTTINYELSSSAEVKLEVFTLLGEKVATLVDRWQEAGYKSVSWEASGVSSGAYFYKLTAGDLTDTRRMILLK